MSSKSRFNRRATALLREQKIERLMDRIAMLEFKIYKLKVKIYDLDDSNADS
jgi:hypothetical protein